MVRDRRGDVGDAKPIYEIDWRKPEAIPDVDLVALVETQYRAGKQRRYGWEAQAAEQLAWARGNQHLVWSHDVRDLVREVFEEKPLEFRNPVVIPKLKGVVLGYLGMTIGHARPSWIVQPATRDDDDVASANVLGKVLHWYWTKGGDRGTLMKLIDGLWMVFCTGVVFAKPTWDPTLGETDRFTAETLLSAGETVESDSQRKKLLDRFRQYVRGFGRKMSDEQEDLELPRGDLVVDFISGFDITEPRNVQNVNGAPWMMESRFRSIEHLTERYGEAADEVQPDEDSEAYDARRQEQYRGWRDYTGNEPDAVPSEEALTHEFWRPRSRSAPVGAKIVVADGKVLHKGPHPYLHGRLPFIRITEMPDPEHFRPGCSVRDAMSLQRAKNHQRSQLHGHLETTVDPRILVEKEAGIPDDAFLKGPRLIPCKDKDAVRAWEPPHPPAYMGDLDRMNDRDFEDVTGLHRSSYGDTEFAGQSGRHAQMLREGDARRLSVVRLGLELSMAAAGQQMAWLLWEFVSVERSLTITGPSRRSEVVTFKGREGLSRNAPFGPHEFNVEVQLGTEPDMNTVLGKIELLSRYRIINPEREQDRLMVMRWLGEQVPSETDEAASHRVLASDENRRMAQGEALRANYGDDDPVHLEEHLQFTTTPDYRRAAAGNTDVELIMQMHLRHHMVQRADKEFRPMAIAKAVQARLVREYGLVSGGSAPQGTGAAGATPRPAGGPMAPGPGGAGGGGNGRIVPRAPAGARRF